MDDVARVVLAFEAPEVAEEILHFLDRSGRARVVATAADDRQLAEAVRQLEPDAVVADPRLARDGIHASPLIAVATRESVASLRAAIRGGARGFFVWPGEREGLLDGVAATLATRQDLERRALVVAVHAARGGAGCTFVATHLAQAFAKRSDACVLVDADLEYGDVTQAIGATGDEVRTIADLVPVADELLPSHVDGALYHHASGFGALLAPPAVHAGAVTPDLVSRAIQVAWSSADIVVLHLPRSLGETNRWAFEEADRVIEVLTLDVLSFRATTRALETLSTDGSAERVCFVVNRAARSEVGPSDVRRVFDADPLAVLPADGSVPRAQDHGKLLTPRGRAGRAFDRLAGKLMGPADLEGTSRS
ncbi:MAG: AAA family ATPase [Actinomycetota bacterium]